MTLHIQNAETCRNERRFPSRRLLAKESRLIRSVGQTMRRFVLLVCAVTLGGVSARARSLTVVNLAGPLVDIAQSSGGTEEQSAAMEELAHSHQDIFSHLFSPEALRLACRTYGTRLEPQLPGLRKLSDDTALRGALESWINDFERAHHDFDRTRVRIVLLPSFGSFRGQARPISGQLTLMIDLEYLATAAPRAFRAMFHHELFHIYHYQIRPEVGAEAEVALDQGKFPSLATLLWVEGMATCAARELNPDASEADLTIDVVARSDDRFWSLLETAMARLDSAGREEISGFFYFPRSDNSIPHDCGYRIGEALFRASRSSRGWPELLALRHAELVATLRVAAEALLHDRSQNQLARPMR